MLSLATHCHIHCHLQHFTSCYTSSKIWLLSNSNMYMYANSKVWVYSSAQSQLNVTRSLLVGWVREQDKITTKDMKCNDLTVTFSVWPGLWCSPPPQYWGGRPHPPDSPPNLPISVPLTAHPEAGVKRQHRSVVAQDHICTDTGLLEALVYIDKIDSFIRENKVMTNVYKHAHLLIKSSLICQLFFIVNFL